MRLLKVLCCGVACVIVFILATSLTIRLLLRDQSTVVCPDVTGLDVEDARRLVERKGLSLLIAKYEKEKDVPYNRVLVQTPDAALSVRKGRTVAVVLSDGPQPAHIPAFVGLSLEEAQAAMHEQGIGLKKVLYVARGAQGMVLAQAPGSGENILDEDGMVLIVGGREKRFYVMPDIVTGDYAGLVRDMEAKHLNYVTVPVAGPQGTARDVALSASIPPGTIFTSDDVLQLQMKGGT
jgi:serine/threonine-protein kinase